MPVLSSDLKFFGSTDKNATGNNISPGNAIGIWLRLTLPAGTSPLDTSVTMRLEGQTT